jgi:hypothetical protein
MTDSVHSPKRTQVKVRNSAAEGWKTQVWINGELNLDITRVVLDFDIRGFVVATISLLADVDAETLAFVNRDDEVGVDRLYSLRDLRAQLGEPPFGVPSEIESPLVEAQQ